jgi:hypothetical protein
MTQPVQGSGWQQPQGTSPVQGSGWQGGPAMQPAPDGSWAFPGQPPSTVQVRTYVTQQQYQIDAAQMAQAGWFPIAQTQVEGDRSAALLILGIIGLLFLLVPGILILILWAVKRGPSKLTVTYQYRAP